MRLNLSSVVTNFDTQVVKNLTACICLYVLSSMLQPLLAQEENALSTEIGVSAIFTSGNTEEENIKFNIGLEWVRDEWKYGFTMDGFRSSQEGDLSAQRLYNVATVTFDMTDNNFIITQASYEDDRFSGYDNQTQISVNYGQSLLMDRENMSFTYNIGLGMRSSRSEEEDFREGILRAEGNYSWNVSENATFTQELSVDGGNESTIVRSSSAIETAIVGDLSMKFSINIKFQSEVPSGREKTDTITALSLIYRF